MMDKFGTCRWAWQIQVMYSFPAHDVPSTETELEKFCVVYTTDSYNCQFLDSIGRDKLPPPVLRAHGGFAVRREDCDGCPCYEAVASPEIKVRGASPSAPD